MANWLNLEGKVVIVTGGASGIGNHVVSTLKAAGATPVIADISVETGEEKDGIFCTKCDVTNKESVEAMVAAVVEKYGKLDAIVNNAGVNLPRLLVDVKGEKPEYELDEKSFNIMFNINVKGLMYCAQAAARQMLKQGGGVIINMSSESGKEGSQGQSAYSATKGACDSFTRSWAKELGKYNIRVVAVAPGIMEATGLRTPAYNAASSPRICPQITPRSSRSDVTASSTKSATWSPSWSPTAPAILQEPPTTSPAASPEADRNRILVIF